MIYRFSLLNDDAKAVDIKGNRIEVGNVIFIESDNDLVKEYAKDKVLAVKPIDYDLPEYDLHGEKIVIHKG